VRLVSVVEEAEVCRLMEEHELAKLSKGQSASSLGRPCAGTQGLVLPPGQLTSLAGSFRSKTTVRAPLECSPVPAWWTSRHLGAW